MDFQSMGFSVRVLNCLAYERIETVDDLCALSERDLLNMRRFGPSSLRDVKHRLSTIGRSLRDDRSARRKVIAAWRGASNVIEQDAIHMVFDDGSVVAWQGHREPEVLLRSEQIDAAFATKPAGGA